MKNSIVIFLITAVSLVILKDWATHAFFYANQDYIAKYLCVNKEQPQVMCQGQCYLESSIKANHEHNSDDNTTVRVEEQRIHIIYTALNNELLLSHFLAPVFKRKPIFNAVNHYLFSYLRDIFHPPSI